MFLDAWDAVRNIDFAGKHLQAYETVKDRLSERHLILIDDTDHVHPWKHTQIVPAALEDGFEVLYSRRQTLLRPSRA